MATSDARPSATAGLLAEVTPRPQVAARVFSVRHRMRQVLESNGPNVAAEVAGLEAELFALQRTVASSTASDATGSSVSGPRAAGAGANQQALSKLDRELGWLQQAKAAAGASLASLNRGCDVPPAPGWTIGEPESKRVKAAEGDGYVVGDKGRVVPAGSFGHRCTTPCPLWNRAPHWCLLQWQEEFFPS